MFQLTGESVSSQTLKDRLQDISQFENSNKHMQTGYFIQTQRTKYIISMHYNPLQLMSLSTS